MRNWFLILIFIGVFAGGYTIEKPWNYGYWAQEHRGIIVFFGEEIWNTNVMHPTISSLDEENIEINQINNNEVKELVVDSRAERNGAKNSKSKCDGIGEKSGSLYGIIFPYYSYDVLVSIALEELIFQTITTCLQYDEYWRNSVNYAVEAMELSYDYLDKKYLKVTDKFKLIENAGICEEDYIYNIGACDEFENLKNNYFGTFKYGDWEEIYLLNVYFKEIGNQSKNSVPNFENYSLIMKSIWSNGLFERMDKLTDEMDEAHKNAEKEISELKEFVKNKKKKVEGEISELDGEKIGNIEQGAVIYGEIYGVIDSFGSEYDSIKEFEELYEEKYLIAIREYTRKNRGYLKNSSILLSELFVEYDELEFQIENLNNELEQLVEEKRLHAKEMVEEFGGLIEGKIIGREVEELYEQAKKDYEIGEKKKTYGEKYEYYMKVMKWVRLAKGEMELVDGKDELEFLALMESVEKLVKNAGKDGIDVIYEEKELDYIKEHQEIEFVENLERIKLNVLEKEMNRFGYLEDEKIVLLKLIESGGNEFGYLKNEMVKAESNFVYSYGIDYLKGAGRLLNLEESYVLIKEILNEEMRNLITKSLRKKTQLTIGSVVLGEESEIIFEIMIENPLDYSINKSIVEIKTPFELRIFSSNILNGGEDISEIYVDKDNIGIYFDRIESRKYYLSFSFTEMVVEVDKFDKKVYGNPDGSIRIEYTYKIDVLYEIDGFWMPGYEGDIVEIGIDGVAKKTEDNFVYGTLAKGKHKFEFVSIYEDGFEIEKHNYSVSNFGLKKFVSYDLEIKPNEYIDKAKIILDEGLNGNVDDLKVFSHSLHSITDKKGLSNGKYGFTIKELKEGDSAIIRIEYYVDNAEEYLNEEYEKVKDEELNSEGKILLGELVNEMQNNETNEAIKTVNKLKGIVDKENSANSKIIDEYLRLKTEIEKEIKKIKFVLDNEEIEKISDEFILKLEARADELDEILIVDMDKEGELNQLKTIDQKWLDKETKDFWKRIYKEYNGLKKELLLLGVEGVYEEVERDLVELEVKKDLEKIVEIYKGLDKLKGILEGENDNVGVRIQELSGEFKGLKNIIENNLGKYENYYEEAKSTKYKIFFRNTPDEIKKSIKDVDKIFENGGSVEVIEKNIEKIQKINEEMRRTYSSMYNESERKLSNIKNIIEVKGLTDSGLVESVKKVENYMKSEEYIKAIKESEVILEKLTNTEEIDGDVNFILIGITALALLAALTAHLLENKVKKDKKKEYIKLKKDDDQEG